MKYWESLSWWHKLPARRSLMLSIYDPRVKIVAELSFYDTRKMEIDTGCDAILYNFRKKQKVL